MFIQSVLFLLLLLPKKIFHGTHTLQDMNILTHNIQNILSTADESLMKIWKRELGVKMIEKGMIC